MPLVAPRNRGSYTFEDVAKHKTADSLWVVMNRKVYDVTAFHKLHPGGPTVLLQMGGKDATEAAAAAHKNALPGNLMWEFCIGAIVRTKSRPPEAGEGPEAAAAPAAAEPPALASRPSGAAGAGAKGSSKAGEVTGAASAAAAAERTRPSAKAAGDRRRAAAKAAQGPRRTSASRPPDRWNSLSTVGGLTVQDELQSEFSAADAEAGGHSVGGDSAAGSSRHDSLEAGGERGLERREVALVAPADVQDLQAIAEPDLTPERGFRELKASQSAVCSSWPIACRLLPQGLQPSWACGA